MTSCEWSFNPTIFVQKFGSSISISSDVSVMNDALLNDEPPCESIVITFAFFSRICSISASQNALLRSSDRPSRSSLNRSYAPYFSNVSTSFLLSFYVPSILRTLRSSPLGRPS